MYISQIRLKGFKSFGGSHLMELAPGFTAIVGPNGSGKSNILDAVRWVLGDNSPARLRISRQSDLLFKGSISSSPANETWSSLHLVKNCEKCILQRSYSPDSGTSVEVDGERIRLSDLENVKRKWNLEGDQFAFISQGEVSETIRQRPMQRRFQLESLFGIDRYRKNREEANCKLEEARKELLRLETLLNELLTRQREIAPDVEKAALAEKIRKDLEAERALYYSLQRSNLQGRLIELNELLVKTAAEYQKCRFWVHAWKKSLDMSSNRITTLSLKLEEDREKNQEIEKKKNETGRLCFQAGTKIKNEKERIRSLEKTNTKLSREIGGLEKEQEDLSSTKSGLISELEFLERECRELKLKSEDSRRQKEKTMSRRSELGDRIEKKSSVLDSLRSSLVSGINFTRNIRDQVKQLEEKTKDLEEKIISVNEKAAEIEKEYSSVVEDHRQIYAECQDLGTRIQQSRRESMQIESRIEQLKSSVEENAYPLGVQFILSASRLGKLPEIHPVAEILSAPGNLSTAIDSYLGGRLFWVVVEKVSVAGRCIEKLKEQKKGIVTFLPLDRCVRRKPVSGFENMEGITGWALDLLSYDKRWEKAVRHLMGDLLIVKSFDVAKAITAEKIRFPLVTEEGDIFASSGTVSGGRSNKGPGLVEKRSELEKKQKEHVELSSILDQLKNLYASKTSQEKELSEKKRELFEETGSLGSEQDRLQNKKRSLVSQREDLLDMESKNLSDLSNKIEQRRSLRRELRALYDELNTLGDISKDERLESLIKEYEEKIRLKEEKIRSVEDIAGRIKRELKRSCKEYETNSAEIDLLKGSLKKCKMKLSDFGKVFLELRQRQIKLKAEGSKASAKLKTEKKRYSVKEMKYNHSNNRLDGNEKHQLTLNREKDSLERELDDIVNTWEDLYPFEKSSENDLVGDPSEVKKRVRKLEKDLREMGDFNRGALSEHQSLEKRISFLHEQMEDARSGINELKEVIQSADSQVDKVFTKALHNIDGKFNQLFRDLFGGGEAHLKPDDSGSLWDSGIEIYARPPGKRLQNIAQLSGGEQSLTAISLLFASMEVAGVPVAILDEVDASLDDVNLGRFVDLVCSYSELLQIIIMTHRRTTMERAQLMYGVTLAEPGLSRIVGVRLEDWQ